MLGRRARRRLRCEVHVPISPTPTFLLRVRLLAASLARFSSLDCRLVVTVSRDVEPYDLHSAEPWSADAGIEWRWMSAEQYARYGIYGTAMVRFAYAFDAPFVLLLDADTLCTGPLTELSERSRDGICGVMAWVTPLLEPPAARGDRVLVPQRFWQDLFAAAGLPEPELAHEHPGWRVMTGSPEAHRAAPPYFNLGMLAGRPETFARIAPVVLDELEVVDRFVDTRFRCQLALTLAAARTATPLVPVPLRFNFPMSPYFWDEYPHEHDVRLLHYAQREEIDRERLCALTDLEALAALDDLSPPAALMRDHAIALLDAMRTGPDALPTHA